VFDRWYRKPPSASRRIIAGCVEEFLPRMRGCPSPGVSAVQYSAHTPSAGFFAKHGSALDVEIGLRGRISTSRGHRGDERLLGAGLWQISCRMLRTIEGLPRRRPDIRLATSALSVGKNASRAVEFTMRTMVRNFGGRRDRRLSPMSRRREGHRPCSGDRSPPLRTNHGGSISLRTSDGLSAHALRV